MDVLVTIIGASAEPADLMVIGSHCVGLDYLIGLLAREGVTAKVLSVGSTAGLMAAKRVRGMRYRRHPPDGSGNRYLQSLLR